MSKNIIQTSATKDADLMRWAIEQAIKVNPGYNTGVVLEEAGKLYAAVSEDVNMRWAVEQAVKLHGPHDVEMDAIVTEARAFNDAVRGK